MACETDIITRSLLTFRDDLTKSKEGYEKAAEECRAKVEHPTNFLDKATEKTVMRMFRNNAATVATVLEMFDEHFGDYLKGDDDHGLPENPSI